MKSAYILASLPPEWFATTESHILANILNMRLSILNSLFKESSVIKSVLNQKVISFADICMVDQNQRKSSICKSHNLSHVRKSSICKSHKQDGKTKISDKMTDVGSSQNFKRHIPFQYMGLYYTSDLSSTLELISRNSVSWWLV